jgi:hypothetical protein
MPTLINGQLHCYWPGITCNALRKVTQINLPKKFLKGAIPSELKLLTTLDNLFLCKCIVCIETERNGCICSDYYVSMCGCNEMKLLLITIISFFFILDESQITFIPSKVEIKSHIFQVRMALWKIWKYFGWVS